MAFGGLNSRRYGARTRLCAPPPAARGAPARTGARLSAYRIDGLLPGLQHEAAGLVVPLIFVFEAGFDIALGRVPGPADRIASFVAGLTDVAVAIATPEPVSCLQIDFTPLGAARFFGPVLADTAGRMVDLETFGDRQLRGLSERPAGTRGWRWRRPRLPAASLPCRHRRPNSSAPSG